MSLYGTLSTNGLVNKTQSPIFILLCVLCFQRQPSGFLFYLTAAVKCHVAAVKGCPVLHHSADYIFISFWIIESILVTLKIVYSTRDVRNELLISIWRLQISSLPKSTHFMPSKYSPWLEMQSFSRCSHFLKASRYADLGTVIRYG